MKTTPPSFRKIALAVLAGTVGIALASCSTAAGFGRDVKKTGNAIERKANS